MPEGAFDETVRRYLGGRSVRAVLREAGLPSSTIKNMRARPSMPPASQIEVIARALGASPVSLTRALLEDRGYDLGEGAVLDLEEGAALARSLTPAQRRLALRIVELIRDTAVGG